MWYGRAGEEFMASYSVFCSFPWNTSKETQTPVWRHVIYNYLMFTVKTAKENTCSYNFSGPKYYFHVVWHRILNEVCVCVHVFMCIDRLVVVTNHVGLLGKNSRQPSADNLYTNQLSVKLRWLSIYYDHTNHRLIIPFPRIIPILLPKILLSKST